MPIEKACLDRMGEKVFVYTVGGYGWQMVNSTEPPPYPYTPDLQIPPPFHVRVKEFVYEENQIAGAFGIIEEPNHEFNGFWSAFFARTDDVLLNFTTNVGPYNVLIAPGKPRMTLKSGLRALHPDSVEADGMPSLRGYAEIALSEEHISKRRS